MWEKKNKIKEKGGIDGAWIYGVYLGLASFNHIIYLTYEIVHSNCQKRDRSLTNFNENHF